MIYFDAAATTLEKPRKVREAMASAVNAMASPGRGGHEAARRAEETAFLCRSEAAKLFGVSDPARVIFTSNATHALNIAIRTLVKPDSRVIISGLEHNAVTRVLHSIPRVRVHVVHTPLFQQEITLQGFEHALKEGTDAVICTHVSNVFGAILPIEQIAALCCSNGVPLIVDASQSAGVLPLDLSSLGADFVAMPGHKGLYGPQGTGLLLCGREDVDPLLCGGTGSVSRQQEMPGELPDRLEAGTHNMPGIAGLLEGLRFIRQNGTEAIRAHEQGLLKKTADALERMEGIRLWRAEDPRQQAGVLSFSVPGRDCEEISRLLSSRGVAVRSGLHCAPLAHQTAGTLEGGTVRLSFSAFNTPRQVNQFIAVLPSILRENVTL